jgi:hypothetical protein
MAGITVSTTDSLDGGDVTKYLGVVSGEAVIGADVVSDIAAGIRDVVGGRSGSYESKIETGRTEAIADIRADARPSVPTPSSGPRSITRSWPRGCSGSTAPERSSRPAASSGHGPLRTFAPMHLGTGHRHGGPGTLKY